MITLNNWPKLEADKNNIETIKADIQEGLVPELPYFIINMNQGKEKISSYITKMSESLQYCVLLANYGNGKSTVLKYLEAYFRFNNKFNTRVLYARADVDKYDIILFLLKQIQNSCLDDLKNAITTFRSGTGVIGDLCNNFNGAFADIKEYAEKLVDETDQDSITKLIFLGTGRLYTKSSFGEFKLSQLSDYNRREILVLFLQLLNYNNHHLIFAIDEIEKIRERSKVRFGHYLTSYRELIDLSSYIKGHMVITASTDAGQGLTYLEEINPAFARRIGDRIIELDKISDKDDTIALANMLNELLEYGKTTDEINRIAYNVSKDTRLVRNSDIIKELCAKLGANANNQSLHELLLQKNLIKTYDNINKQLEFDGLFGRIHQKFFNPLEDYIKANNIIDFSLKAQEYQCYINNENNTISIFLFAGDFEANVKRINNLLEEFNNYNFIIYTPNELSISHGTFANASTCINIINYEPKELMTLLVMFRDENLEYGDSIKEVIEEYTKHNL